MAGTQSIQVTMGTTSGVGNTKDRHIEDFYATEPRAVAELLKREQFSNIVWECACGQGHLSKEIRRAGYEVYSTDIIDRGYERFDGVVDFLSETTIGFITI